MNKHNDGEIKAMYIMGENPMVSDPDLHHVEKALDKLECLIVQDIFLTETAQMADGYSRRKLGWKRRTFTSTERRVQRIRKAVSPPGEARQDWQILCDMSTQLGIPCNMIPRRRFLMKCERLLLHKQV
jgi:predicted molibdopterin-dependent oxidoreductase YjgC